MRVDWCVSSWFRIKKTHSLTNPTQPKKHDSQVGPSSLAARGNPSSRQLLALGAAARVVLQLGLRNVECRRLRRYLAAPEQNRPP